MFNRYTVCVLLLFSLAGMGEILAQSDNNLERAGIIKGHLVNKSSRLPLRGITVKVLGMPVQTITDQNGDFTISDVAVGIYVLEFSLAETVPVNKTDVVVKSNRITYIEFEMTLQSRLHEQVTVVPDYFPEQHEMPVSSMELSSEEIRRAPGTAGDVSRIISSFPSVAKINDTANSLVVRGGNPAENAFFIDNIEVPNINHFPMQGVSGGAIGLLNVDFIQDVNFYSGNFGPQYGDKLSSVMDIAYRQGNRERMEGQTDLNLAGFGGQFEGPLFGQKGTWMLSAHRSYLDLLVDSIGTGVAPRYGDFQGKMTLDLSTRHHLTFLGILGLDSIKSDRDQSIEDDNPYFGESQSREGVIGINWLSSWTTDLYSETSVSYSYSRFRDIYQRISTDSLFVDNRSIEDSFNVRHVTHWNPGRRHEFILGQEVKRLEADYQYVLGESTNVLGHNIPEMRGDIRQASWKNAYFVNYRLDLSDVFGLSGGFRFDHFSYTKHSHVSPRVSLTVRFSNKSSMTAAVGQFTQSLPDLLVFQHPEFKNLQDPRAMHYTVSFSRRLTDNTRLIVEAYDKEYRHMPLNLDQPELFVFDSLTGGASFLINRLNDDGRAYARGMEISIQKKLKDKVYGMISMTYSKTRYRDLGGIWRDRSFDNRFLTSIEGGYNFSPRWEFSTRWIFAGGVPYTPWDLEQSTLLNTGIYDQSRINAERRPAYHSLNLRMERRFHFLKSNMTVALDIWNAYDRKNIGQFYWNEVKNEPGEQYQWSMLPVLGLEYEF